MLNKLVKEAYKTAVKKGWWKKRRSLLEVICLMHSELSEAVDAYRKGKGDDKIVEELSDAIIRIFDLCGSRGWDLDGAVRRKMDFNKTRPYRHGGLRA